MNDLDNTLIVGGSKGIGLSLAKQSMSEKHHVTVVSREKSPELKKLKIEHIAQDYNDVALIRPLLKRVQPSTLILCVANGICSDSLKLPHEKIIRCIQTTYLSTIFWLKEAIDCLPKHSKVCWISSLTAKVPDSNWSYYASAKAGVEHFIQCVGQTVKDKEISITICYPGCVATGFHNDSGAQVPANAVPSFIFSSDVLKAIEKRRTFWAAPMDIAVVSEIYKSDRNRQYAFQEVVK